MTQLVLSPRASTDSARLGMAAARRGWQTVRLPSWRIPPGFDLEDRVAVYGEPLFGRVVAAQCGRVLLEPPHDWLARLPLTATRRAIRGVTLRDVAALTYPVFLKPPDDKLFPAKVYTSPGELLARTDLAAEQPVIASEPVVFVKEFRVHMLHHSAVTASRYAVNGDIAESDDDPDGAAAVAFADDVVARAADITPPAVVVDVGLLASGDWAVVEANPVFGAGLYAGQPAAILDVLLAACHPRETLDAALSGFVCPVVIE